MFARVTAKGQATIPSKVRKHLGIRPGDRIEFTIRGNRVTVRRVEPLDAAFLRLSEENLTEWLSPEDERAYRDL